MTDHERLIEMFERAKIEYRPAHSVELEEDAIFVTPPSLTGIVVEGGYFGFYSIFTFTEDGSLVNLEAHE